MKRVQSTSEAARAASNPNPVPVQKQGLPDGGFLTVACKLPHGIVLRVFDMVPTNIPIHNGVGYREVLQAKQRPGEFTLFGTAVAMGVVPKCKIVAGYALTQKVPAELYRKWLEQNKDSDIVKNNLIFAYESLEMAEGAAQERGDLRHGMEPMALVGRDPRAPRGIQRDDGTDGSRKAA